MIVYTPKSNSSCFTETRLPTKPVTLPSSLAIVTLSDDASTLVRSSVSFEQSDSLILSEPLVKSLFVYVVPAMFKQRQAVANRLCISASNH